MWIRKIKSKLKQSEYGRKLRLSSNMKKHIVSFPIFHCPTLYFLDAQQANGDGEVTSSIRKNTYRYILQKKPQYMYPLSVPALRRDISACTFVLSIYVQSRKAAFSNPDVLDMKNYFASHIRLRWSYPILPFPLSIFYYMAWASEMKQNS